MSVSQLDNSITINNDMWAVTLTTDKKKSNHAVIIIEGQREGISCIKKVHLMGVSTVDNKIKEIIKQGCFYFYSTSGRPEIENIRSGATIRYHKKTETWRVSSQRVQQMIDSVEKEKTENRTPFSIFGAQSVLSKSAEYYEIHDKELEELSRTDPTMLRSIISEWRNPGSTFENFQKINTAFPIIGIPVSLIYLQITKKIFSYSWEERNRYLNLAYTHITLQTKRPQNCFTWAREKLRTVGVVMPSKTIDIFICATGLYVE